LDKKEFATDEQMKSQTLGYTIPPPTTGRE